MDEKGLNSGSSCSIQLCLMYWRMGAGEESLWVQLQIWPAVTGESTKCSINSANSRGVGTWAGTVDSGNLLSASMLLWASVLRKTSEYTFAASKKDHLLIHADAWGEVDQCLLNKANKGLWSVTKLKWWPSIYEWNRFTPNTQASHSFSSWELGVVLLRWWQCTCSVYSIGLSVPSSIRWTSTAPIPYADASQARVSGRLASKWTRSLEDVNNSLDLRKAFSSSAVHCHWDSFLSKRYNGANTVETSGRNLQY